MVRSTMRKIMNLISYDVRNQRVYLLDGANFGCYDNDYYYPYSNHSSNHDYYCDDVTCSHPNQIPILQFHHHHRPPVLLLRRRHHHLLVYHYCVKKKMDHCKWVKFYWAFVVVVVVEVVVVDAVSAIDVLLRQSLVEYVLVVDDGHRADRRRRCLHHRRRLLHHHRVLPDSHYHHHHHHVHVHPHDGDVEEDGMSSYLPWLKNPNQYLPINPNLVAIDSVMPHSVSFVPTVSYYCILHNCPTRRVILHPQ